MFLSLCHSDVARENFVFSAQENFYDPPVSEFTTKTSTSFDWNI